MGDYIYKTGWAIGALFCLSIVACAGVVTSAPTHFFMFNPVNPTMAGQPGSTGRTTVRVNLEPVEIPRYLNRPQIVTLENGVEYHLDEFNQWLEPLGDNVTRVVAENLSEILDTDGIDIFTMIPSLQTDYRIAVQILRLDGKRGRNVVLAAKWALFEQTENVPVITKRFVTQETVNDDNYQSFVKAQNRTIESLSREIADAIRLMVLQSAGS